MSQYYTLRNDNKIKKAIALKYNEEKDLAPKITANGHGIMADKIIALAEENDIKIEVDEDLVKILSILELNDYIPLEIYGLVAEILANIYNTKN